MKVLSEGAIDLSDKRVELSTMNITDADVF